MSNLILELSVGLKKLFREKINIVIFLLFTILAVNIYGIHLLKNRIDYRYFNTTTSLEEIHGVDINTYNGEIKYKPKNPNY